MTYLTSLTLRSGDRAVLDATVDDIKRFVTRKGAEMKGPHPRPPQTLHVPLTKQLDAAGNRFPPWRYTVYRRDIEIRGFDRVAREVTNLPFPPSVHVAVEIEQVGPAR